MTDAIINWTQELTPLNFVVGDVAINFTVSPAVMEFNQTVESVTFESKVEQVAFEEVLTKLEFTIDDVVYVEGTPEEDMVYAKRVDFITESLFYRGEAEAGTATSAAGWRIRRVTIGDDNDVTEEWADGTAGFTKTWDNRASYAYS